MKPILPVILVFILAGCAPSQETIQTAIARTQAGWTPTPISTTTNTSCTDKGWEDIAVYLRTAQEVQSVETFTNMKSKISDVQIDLCTEKARQLILTALASEIESNQNSDATPGFIDYTIINVRATQAVKQAILDINLAKAILDDLGIKLQYP